MARVSIMQRVPPLSERALRRSFWAGKDTPIPDDLAEPWVVRFVRIRDGDLNRRFYVVIPRARARDWEGEAIPLDEAVRIAEGIFSWSDWSRTVSQFIGMDRLIKSPAPATYDEGNNSPRRRYCDAHCSKCGLHFSSDAAFEQHCWDGHKHPSKSDKLVACEGRDTGCYVMPGLAYDEPLRKYLPDFNQSYAYVPGVRVWEHVQARRVREYYAARR